MHNNVTGDSLGAEDFSSGQPIDLVVRLIVSLLKHRCVWSGTASELVGALKNIAPLQEPIVAASSQAMYSHVVSQVESLRACGVDVVLGSSYPRVLSFRAASRVASTNAELDVLARRISTAHNTDLNIPTVNAPRRHTGDNNAPRQDATSQARRRKTVASAILAMSKLREEIAGSRTVEDDATQGASTPLAPAADDTLIATHRSTGQSLQMTKSPQASIPEDELPPIFDDVADAYLGICEMESQVRSQSDANSILQIVAEQIQRISGADGVAAGLNRNGHIKSLAVAGVAKGQPEAHRLLSLANRGAEPTLVRFDNARTDTAVTQLCSRIGIRSVFVSSFSVAGNLWGSIALLFREPRRFEKGDVLVIKSASDVLANATRDVRAAS